MSRASRASMAQKTLRILEEGSYVLADGQRVEIGEDIKHCVRGTRLLEPAALAELAAAETGLHTASAGLIEVENTSTLAGIQRLLREGAAPVAALNFASARNPGGGFLGGAQAQEESLARSSGLYASLLAAQPFYEHHRREPSLLYSDALILSPHCPVFRDDAGALLREAHRVSFISGAAPNAGALRQHGSPEAGQIGPVLRRRIGYVLALAAAKGYRALVLGAWGCGVFRNDPDLVAQMFRELLREEGWERRFPRLLFAVLDNAAEGRTFRAFRAALQP